MASIRNPDEFIKEYVQMGQPVPVPILLLAAIAFALKPVAIFISFSGAVEFTDVIRNGILAKIGVQFLTVFLLWFLLGLSFFAISKVLGGRPSLGRLLRSIPWGFIFLVPAAIFRAVGTYLGLERRIGELFGEENLFPVDVFLTPGMEVQFRHIEQLEAAAKETAIYTPFLVANIVFVVAAAAFWYFAVKHSTQLDEGGSMITTAIPTAVYIIWLIGLI